MARTPDEPGVSTQEQPLLPSLPPEVSLEPAPAGVPVELEAVDVDESPLVGVTPVVTGSVEVPGGPPVMVVPVVVVLAVVAPAVVASLVVPSPTVRHRPRVRQVR